MEFRRSYAPDPNSCCAARCRKVKFTLHWVSAAHAKPVEVRLYDHLLMEDEADGAEETAGSRMNPESLTVLKQAMVEPSLAEAVMGSRFQFLRHGYFCLDKDSKPDDPVFNRIVSLRDSWAKAQKA